VSDIVERLREGCQFYGDGDPDSWLCHRIECEAAEEIVALRAAVADLKEERRWVPVEERRPELGKRVFVRNVEDGWFCASNLDVVNDKDYWEDVDEVYLKSPTHWQEIVT
jgi:hypothetical protein